MQTPKSLKHLAWRPRRDFVARKVVHVALAHTKGQGFAAGVQGSGQAPSCGSIACKRFNGLQQKADPLLFRSSRLAWATGANLVEIGGHAHRSPTPRPIAQWGLGGGKRLEEAEGSGCTDNPKSTYYQPQTYLAKNPPKEASLITGGKAGSRPPRAPRPFLKPIRSFEVRSCQAGSQASLPFR